MDRDTRNLLQRATQAARRLLEEEYQQQLEGTFDILINGTIAAEPGAHLDARQRLVRRKIVAAIEHHREQQHSENAAAVQAYLRESAFTTLNRFVALKMLEARQLVQECLSRGEQSAGFREFAGLSPGLNALPDHGYRLYIECLFDEIGRDVRVLFHRLDSAALLWPRRTALTGLLEILNQPALAAVWVEDETIGWVYQYFNDDAERRAMRDASSAPRDSRELAVRNQFFTPRYVVCFLTDNTLGRLWYEMMRGQTALASQCEYLVRRPTEIFLKAGEDVPAEVASDEASASQEELLKQPVYIPHRPLKDPREIRLLDPACGSMHFGLYAFDLFEIIYDEAWDIARGTDEALKSAPSFASFVSYVADFPDKAAFLREVPRLIIERNIHGIDIDPRATQIAGLALWLRAQKSWQQQGVRPAERPAIRKSNIVCAEPMPGEPELLREFTAELEPPALRGLFEAVVGLMRYAGEAGSLLRIEDDIRAVIADAKQRWRDRPRQTDLFPAVKKPTAQQGELTLDVSGIPDERFWDEEAEPRIYAALREYAARAASAEGFQRRLFAEDAERGFAFIDLCNQEFDVALMNPPFGDTAKPAKTYIASRYPRTKHDLFAAFIERGLSMLVVGGLLGAITSRTGFFLGSFQKWREEILLLEAHPSLLADLGMGVLDGAMVETAAYTMEKIA